MLSLFQAPEVIQAGHV